MKQDAKDYSPITELSKAEADDLLEKAANGKLILHAAISAHTAQLFATPFAKVARQGSIKTIDRLVPITIQTANRLKFSHDATIESYLAIDPTLYPDTHPLADHLYFLDVPQTVTREQIYFRCDDAKVETAPVAKDAMKAGTNIKTWDDARLRALWEESNLPGVTQQSLAKKHGVSRQRIGALLGEAKGKFSKMKSTSPNKNPWGGLIK